MDPTLQFYYFNIDATKLPHYEWQLLYSILEDCQEVFLNELLLSLPPKRNVDHQIQVIPGVAPYWLSWLEGDEINTQLMKYLGLPVPLDNESDSGLQVLWDNESIIFGINSSFT